MLKELFYNEDAQSTTEYILIIALIAVVCIAVIRIFGGQIKEMLTKSTDKIKTETKGFDD